MPSASSPTRTLTRDNATTITPTPRPPLAEDPAVRAVVAIGLMSAGIIHALLIHGQIHGAVWLTLGFFGLALVAPLAGLWLLARPSLLAWLFGALVCAGAAGGYILTRSVPVPGDAADFGNWLQPLGVAALITEGIVIILTAGVLASVVRASPFARY